MLTLTASRPYDDDDDENDASDDDDAGEGLEEEEELELEDDEEEAMVWNLRRARFVTEDASGNDKLHVCAWHEPKDATTATTWSVL